MQLVTRRSAVTLVVCSWLIGDELVQLHVLVLTRCVWAACSCCCDHWSTQHVIAMHRSLVLLLPCRAIISFYYADDYEFMIY